MKALAAAYEQHGTERPEVIEIYRRRWQIESLYKQLKQNFPLHFFYGESANAIETQIWVVMIANLLVKLVKAQVSLSVQIGKCRIFPRIYLQRKTTF